MKSLFQSNADLKLSRAHFFWGVAVTCQVLFWYFAVPGPQLMNGYIDSLDAGVEASAWTALFLLAIPLSLWSLSGVSFSRLGLGIGDWKFGLTALVVLGPIIGLMVWLGTSNQPIQDFYPIVGNDVSGTGSWAYWFLWYGLFYIAFEFFYRGVLLQGPKDWPESTRITMAVVCCTLIHLGKPLIETAASLPASLLFVFLALRTRSIWYGFLLHWLIGIVNDLGAIG